MGSLLIVPDAINGIDLCGEFQWPIDARKIKEAGFEYAYVQSSRYSSQRCGNYDRLVGQLRDAGLSVGAYHFCSHGTDPVQQARFFHQASDGLGSHPGELPPMADWEFCTPSNYHDLFKYPEGHPQHCVSWISAFLKECKALWYGPTSSRLPVIYSYPAYCGAHSPALAKELSLGEYPLCWASYREDGSIPTSMETAISHHVPLPWAKHTLCQYSGNNGKPVPGVSGPCDRQVFFGSSAEWATFRGLQRDVSLPSWPVKEDVYER